MRARPSRLVLALEDLRAAGQLSRKELAQRLGHTRGWWDNIVRGDSNLSVADADAVAALLRGSIEVRSAAHPEITIAAALDADDALTPEWRDAVWTLYQRAKEQSARRAGRPLPTRRVIDRFLDPAAGSEPPRRKRSRAAASSE